MLPSGSRILVFCKQGEKRSAGVLCLLLTLFYNNYVLDIEQLDEWKDLIDKS